MNSSYFVLPAVALLGVASLRPEIRAEEASAFQPPPLKVPDGFTIELAAAPPLVKHPMMACFDDCGRLFIAESQGKNLAKEELLEHRGRFIRMLEDTNGDGTFDKSTIFADKLVMPEGALWHRGSLFVLSSPYLWRFQDTNDDGVADVREKLVGYMDFNGKANQHGAYLGPNGRLYFSGGVFGYDLTSKDGSHVAKGSAAGVFSCRQDGTDVQVFGNGGINPVEVAFTREGELLTTCPIFDSIGGRHDALIHWVRGAIAGPKDYQPPVLKPTGYRLPALRRWGQVAPSGLTRYRGDAFGPTYHNTFFATHSNTAKVINTRLERTGSTFQGDDEDFLVSTSRDFHPTDVLEDADGSLLIIDTGGWFVISCPFSQMAKPNILGAIYRVRRNDASAISDSRGINLDWSDATSCDLADRLDDRRHVVRDRGIEQLAARGEEAVSALQHALSAPSVRKRRNAVWALSRIGTQRARRSIRQALSDADATVKQAAARSVGVLGDRGAVSRLLTLLTSQELPMRRSAATALGEIGDSVAVPHLLSALANEGDNHLRHALVYALIEIGDFDETSTGLAHSNPRVQHGALVAMNQIDGSQLTRRHVAPLVEATDAMLKSTALEIITTREGWSDEIVDFLQEWSISDGHDTALAPTARVAVASFPEDVRLQQIVQQALASPRTADGVRETLLQAIGRLRQLPDAWVQPLAALLQQEDHALKTIAAIAASPTTQLNEHLAELGRNPTTPDTVRLAAWLCLGEKGAALSDEPFSRLMDRVTAATAPLDRLAAARAVARAQLDRRQLNQVVDALSQVGPIELPTLMEAVGQTVDADAELLKRFVAALEQSPAASSVSADQLRRILLTFPEHSRPSADPLLIKLKVSNRQVSERVQHVAKTLGVGDVEHGKAIFFSNRAACSACHAVNEEGGDTGPDLSRIGAIRRRADLLEAILFPSASIVNSFETFSVLTQDGRVVQGVMQRAELRWLVLRDSQRNEIVIPREDIEELTRTQTSIMPQGLEGNLSTQQLSDLVAYLMSLTSPEDESHLPED